MANKAAIQEISETLNALLHAVLRGNLETYQALVSEDLTCFEPESAGCQVRGTALHRFFIQKEPPAQVYHFELVDPSFRICGDMAVAAYTLLSVLPDGEGFATRTENVTRIFQRQQGTWKMIHFHRSRAKAAD